MSASQTPSAVQPRDGATFRGSRCDAERVPAPTDPRCEDCGTQLGEVLWSVQARRQLCFRCYIRATTRNPERSS